MRGKRGAATAMHFAYAQVELIFAVSVVSLALWFDPDWHSGRNFFDLLRGSGAKRIVDVRLNNVSQLAGFAKKDDLAYFANAICGMDYIHLPALAPTQEMLDQFLCDRGLLKAEDLRQSLESAFAFVHEKDDDPDRDRAFAHLERVVRYLQCEIPCI